MSMSDDELVGRITDTVKALLETLLSNDAEAIATYLVPNSFIDIGRQLFGLDALSVPMGFAVGPHHIGLTAVQAGDGLAVVELRGRNEQEEDVSVCSVFLSQEPAGWRVEDIWPAPAEADFDATAIAEPTALFYTGDLQLALVENADLDPVEARLVPGLQHAAFGLHLIERGVHLWRTYRGVEQPDLTDASGWAAGVQLAVELLAGHEPDPAAVAAQYRVLAETAVARFSELITLLSAEGDAEGQAGAVEPPIVTPSAQILDSSGRPISSGRRPSNDGMRPGEGPGGLILPRG
jgi:hypothetical protein